MRLITQPANNENRKKANMKFQYILAVVFALMLVSASSGYAQPRAGKLLQSGLYQEEVKGDLEAAIKIYERIVINFSKNRPVAAKALLHIGLCKEKLGRNEAINAYQKVVELYPEQTEPAAIAREKLEMLARLNTLDSEGDSRFRMRRVCEASGWWKGCSISPNGRFFAFSDRKNDYGEVSLYDLSSGTIRHLTNDANQDEGAHECVVSPDGEQIAYCWINNSNGTQELRLVGTDGYRPKTLYRDKDGFPITPFDWSPNGKEILVFHKGIAMVSVDDGSVRVLKKISPRLLGKVNMRISPNGRYIAYDLLQKGDITQKDIYILATDGSNDAPLIEKSSNDVLLDWYPDGKSLLFRSDRTGDWDAWRIRVKGGKPYGTAELVKKDLGSISLLGFTRDGSFYFKSSMGGMDIYTAHIDLSKGKIVDGPKKPIERGVGGNVSAAWSPDGKYLAYIAGGSIHIRSEETGTEKEISPQPGFYGIEWFPDGSFLKVYGEDKEANRGLFRVDTKTGAVETLLMQTPEVYLHRCCLGPEGKKIYYKSYQDSDNLTSIFAYDIRSKQKKKIWHGNVKIEGPEPSPDGQWLAMEIYQADGSGSQLAVMPINGGEIRELTESSSGGEFVWTPDSKELLFAKFVAGSGWGSSRQELWIVPLSGGAPKSLSLESRMMWLLTMHPDGEQIAYTSDKDKAEIWVMENFLPKEKVAQRPTFRKINIASKPQNGVLSPEGNRLAFVSDGAVWVVPLHGKVDPDIAGEPIRIAEVPGIWDNGSLMAWSTDGEWIAVNTWPDAEDVFVHVIPAAGGESRVVQMPKRGGHSWSYRLSLSPDGQMLAFSARELRKPRQKTSDAHDRYICTIPTAGGEPKQVSSGWGRMPSFSPDGETIAYVDDVRKNWQGTERYLLGGELWIVPYEDGTPVKLASVDGRLRGPVWSPDGKYIAAHHEPGGSNDSKEIWVFPVSADASSAGEPEKIALPRSSWNMLAGWTPDNELGVFISTEEQCAIYTVPASGGKAMQITLTEWPYYPRWSPDGERIYFRGDNDKNALVSYVPAAGGQVGKVPLQMEQFNSTVPGGGHNISPDGKRIVMSASHDIWTITLDGGMPTRLTNDDSHETYPCWSPDGEWVAFIDEVNYAIYIVPAGGGEIRQVSSESDRKGSGAITFSPDGKRIAFFSDGSIKTIPVEGGESTILVGKVKSNYYSQLVYSPDGSKIAHNALGKIWITRLDGSEPEEFLTGLPAGARLVDVDWSPDGKKIVFIALIGGEAEFWLIENFLPESVAVASE